MIAQGRPVAISVPSMVPEAVLAALQGEWSDDRHNYVVRERSVSRYNGESSTTFYDHLLWDGERRQLLWGKAGRYFADVTDVTSELRWHSARPERKGFAWKRGPLLPPNVFWTQGQLDLLSSQHPGEDLVTSGVLQAAQPIPAPPRKRARIQHNYSPLRGGLFRRESGCFGSESAESAAEPEPEQSPQPERRSVGEALRASKEEMPAKAAQASPSTKVSIRPTRAPTRASARDDDCEPLIIVGDTACEEWTKDDAQKLARKHPLGPAVITVTDCRLLGSGTRLTCYTIDTHAKRARLQAKRL